MWWKTLGKVGGVVFGGVAANYHLSTSPVDIYKMRQEEIGGKTPTPLVYPEDMQMGVAAKLLNSIGDTTYRFFGHQLFRVDSKENKKILEDLREFLPEEEIKEVEKPLHMMAKSCNPAEGSSTFQCLAFSSFINRSLKARYEVEKTYHENKEEYDKEKLKPQIIVTGMPRTGSTFLHQLLSQDPNCRFLSAWEQQIPVPFPTKETYKTDVRIKQCQGFQKMADHFVTNYNKYFRMYHDVDGAQVEEELYILLHTLTMPSMIPWNEEHWQWNSLPNKQKQYQYLRKFLKMSQYHHSPKSHFVLKSPVHGWHFAELMETFKTDRVIVVTHRDPLKVIGSFGKLQLFVGALSLRNTVNDPYLIKETFGIRTMELVKLIVDNIAQTRKELDPKVEKEILDIEFSDIVANPMGVVEKIYERAGLELTEDARESMQNYLEENSKQRKAGKGSSHCPYSLDEFGITEEDVKEVFKDYIEKRGYEN